MPVASQSASSHPASQIWGSPVGGSPVWVSPVWVSPVWVSPMGGSHYSQVGPHLGLRVAMWTFFRFWVPKRSPFFSRSPLSPFQTEECAKSQSSHYLLNVDHLNTCDDKTSFNESHASLSVKLSFVLKYSNTCTCFLLCISRN